jgi:glycosyltransferase involved in cell wall biosynthesis
MMPRPKLCMVTTSPIVVRFFLIPHLRLLAKTFEVTLVSNSDCAPLLGNLASKIRMTVIPVEREISPWHDMKALVQLTKLFFDKRFDAVITVAPKAGLLGILGAFFARVPYRCHVFQGEVWASRRGPMRAVLRLADQVISRAASEVLVVSASERAYLISENILTSSYSTVLGAGSICGVDTVRFAPNPEVRAKIRKRFNIPAQARVVLFVGRLHRDKGILDLVIAWSRLAGVHRDLHLVIVGPDESDLTPAILALAGCAFTSRLHVCGLTSAPEEYMAAADILCLPSYREGFGNVIIEAGATELAVVATRIYGIQDALVENVTGLAYPPGNIRALMGCLTTLLQDSALRLQYGKAGRELVVANFEQSQIVQAYAKHFTQRCLDKVTLP